MCMEKTPWERVVEFHGHVCPGLAIGFRATELALNALGGNRSEDEELIAIVENNACGVDAVQALAGCTFGKGNLLFRDNGKQVYTFARRKDGRAVRVSVRYGAFHDESFKQLRGKVMAGSAGAGEIESYRQMLSDRIEKILHAGTEAFDLREVQAEIPAKAVIYPSLQCFDCGESVMEPRARVRGGKIVCMPCADKGE
ncbi:MAG: TraR/DksA C4-type zinc finger protein [Peptococcaceae bacterium]|nr:TraR/DksA C4-type zinc finger protein [Peptococcaceae bacterium]